MSDEKTTTHKRRENNRTSGKAHADKLRKRAEAEVRKAEHDKMTTAQKLAELDMLFGKNLGGTNERKRLLNPKPAAAKEGQKVESATEPAK